MPRLVPEIRGPRNMVGPMLRYFTDPYGTLPHYARCYGDPFFLPVPGTSGTVVTGNPDGLKTIFSAAPDTFEPMASDAHRRVMGARGFFARSDANQRRARRLVQPTMIGARLRAFGPSLQRAIDARTGHWRNGDVADFRALGKAVALDAMCAALFGDRASALRERLETSFAEGIERTSPAPLYLPFLRHEFGGIGPWARAMRMLRETMAILKCELEHRAATAPGDGITGALLEVRDADGQAMDLEEAQHLLYDLAIAGYDTSASALAWAAHDLSHHRAAQERLAEELRSLGPDANPDALTRLPYLDAVYKETLRRRPVLILVSRRLRAPFTLLGHDLPTGVGVSAAIGIAHYREDIYPAAYEFRPERFLERSYAPQEFLPFGGGAKRCLGASLAEYEMKVALGTLFARFELIPTDPRPVRARPKGVSVSPARPVMLRIRPRR